MDRSRWVFMKQFAAGTAVLQTPRPITFELDFFAAVAAAAAACETHTRFSLRGRDGLPHPIWGSFAPETGQWWAKEGLGV